MTQNDCQNMTEEPSIILQNMHRKAPTHFQQRLKYLLICVGVFKVYYLGTVPIEP